jgi:hypothetical protein
MIAVREEMAGAIQKYAEPVTAYSVLHHQVQYLVSPTISILLHNRSPSSREPIAA